MGFGLEDRRKLGKLSPAPASAQQVFAWLLMFADFHASDCACTIEGHRVCDGGEDLKCWPSVTTLAKLTKLIKLSVRRNLDTLEALGIIRREARMIPGTKRHLSNVYHILLRQGVDSPTNPGSPTSPGWVRPRAQGGIIGAIQTDVEEISKATREGTISPPPAARSFSEPTIDGTSAENDEAARQQLISELAAETISSIPSSSSPTGYCCSHCRRPVKSDAEGCSGCNIAF